MPIAMRTRNGCADELVGRLFWRVPFEATARLPVESSPKRSFLLLAVSFRPILRTKVTLFIGGVRGCPHS